MSMEVIMNDGDVERSFWDFKGKVEYVDGWFLMRTPITLLLITIAYLFFVFNLGPKYMKNRPAFKLVSVLAAYNVAQVAMSCYLCYILERVDAGHTLFEATISVLGTGLMLPNGLIHASCLMDREDTKLCVTSAIYAYFIAKLSELLDTIFFVFKKNYRQVTFLHVYHHCIMLWSTWFTLKYEPSYSTIFLGTVNSFVHVVMYSYYGLSTFPSISKYLWWKKYITKMQIIQFILIILQAAVSYACSGCPPSYTLLATIMFNAFLFIGLFVNFYLRSYKKPKTID